jgi:hypothetical protein
MVGVELLLYRSGIADWVYGPAGLAVCTAMVRRRVGTEGLTAVSYPGPEPVQGHGAKANSCPSPGGGENARCGAFVAKNADHESQRLPLALIDQFGTQMFTWAS